MHKLNLNRRNQVSETNELIMFMMERKLKLEESKLITTSNGFYDLETVVIGSGILKVKVGFIYLILSQRGNAFISINLYLSVM